MKRIYTLLTSFCIHLNGQLYSQSIKQARILTFIVATIGLSYFANAQQASAIKIAPVSGSAPTITTPFIFTWNSNASPNKVIVVISDSTSTFTPTNLVEYAATTNFGGGTDVGTGGGVSKVVYNGLTSAQTTASITNLQAGSPYLIQVFEYTGTVMGGNNDEIYNVKSATNNPIRVKYYVATPAGKWGAPPSVTSAKVQAWGGGAGGAGRSGVDGGSGGGGGGGYSEAVVTVSPGTGYTITVGAAAAGVAGDVGTPGNDTWFSPTNLAAATILARGGSTGGEGTSTPSITGGAGGAGGLSGTATGTSPLLYLGGDGGRGRAVAAGIGGPGGSSAGIGSDGVDEPDTWASLTASSSNPAGSGKGGNGGANDAVGVIGNFPGGGGGGSGSDEGTDIDLAGGAGSQGLLVISYQPPAVLSANTFTTTQIKVKFNSTITSVAQANGSGFTITGATISAAAIDGGDATVVNLTVSALSPTFTCTNCLSVSPAAVFSAGGSNALVSGQSVTDGIAPTAPNKPASLVAGTTVNDTEEAAGVVIRVPLGTSGAVSGDLVRLLLGGSNFPSPITAILNGTDITNTYKEVTISTGQLGVEGSKLISARIEDVAANVGVASPDLTLTLDQTGPSSMASFTKDLIKNGTAQSVTVTFGESVTGTPKITVSGSTVGVLVNNQNMSGSGTTWTYPAGSVWANNNEVFTVTVGTATDTASNPVNSTPGNNTFTVDNSAPAAPTISAVTVNPTAGTEVAGYYNISNVANTAGITFSVAVAADPSLVGGTLQLEVANQDVVVAYILLDSLKGIPTAGTTQNILIPHDTLVANGEYGNGKELSFRAIITDLAGNSTTGPTASATLKVDLTAPSNQNAVYTASTSSVGGGSVTLTAGSSGNKNWFAPSGTTSFVANATTITTAAGDATSIIAPTTTGTYKLFVVDSAGNPSAQSTATLTVGNAPSTPPSAVVFSNDIDVSMTVAWTPGNGTRKLVIASLGVTPPDTDPSNFTNYVANSTWNGGGTAIGNAFVVYDGTSNSFSFSTIVPGTYNFAVYEYNGSSPATGAFNMTQATASHATRTQATSVNLSSPASTITTVNWSVGTGTRRMVIVKTNGAAFTPADGTQYTGFTDFGATGGGGTDLNGVASGTVKCVYDGTAATVPVTDLLENTAYTFQVYEYIGTGATTIYLQSTGTGNPLDRNTVEATQPTAPTAITFNAIYADSITLTVTGVGNGASRMIAVSTTAITFDPADGISYTANRDFTLANDVDATANVVKVVGYGSGQITVKGLSADQVYQFAVFEFNGAQNTGAENYNTTEFETGRNTKPSAQANTLTFASVTASTMTLNWTNGGAAAGDRRVVVMKAGSAVGTDHPSDLTTYTANANWGTRSAANRIGSSNAYVVFDGAVGSTSTGPITNLQAGVTYHFAIYEYNSFVGAAIQTSTLSAAFLTPSTAISSQQTTADATAPAAAGFTTSTVTSKGDREVAGYWNSTNDSISVIVPLENTDPTLDMGRVQIQLRNLSPTAFVNIGGALDAPGSGNSTITYAQRQAGTKTINISRANLIGTAGFTEPATLKFTAIIYDYSGNSKLGTESTTNIVVDETLPQISTATVVFDDGGSNRETITMTFSETLSMTAAPLLGGSFGFTVNDVDGIRSGGNTAFTAPSTIVLESVANGDWAVGMQVTYTAGSSSGNIVKDAAGNEMATVTKSTSDAVKPYLISGMVFNSNGAGKETITFQLSETLSLAEDALVTGFTPSTGGIDLTQCKYTGRGSTNTITLTSANNGDWTDATTMAYALSGNVTDPSTNELAIFGAEPILLKSINIVSNNALNPTTFAKAGDVITVTFTVAAGKTLSSDSVAIFGIAATKDVSVIAPNYKYTYTTSAANSNSVIPIYIRAKETGPPAKQTNTTFTTNTPVGSSIIFDKTAPTQPSLPDLDIVDDLGSSNTDNITSAFSGLTISGTAENNSSVIIYNSATPLDTVTATAGGAWTVDLALAEAVYSINVKAYDAAGNLSIASSPLGLTIDTTVVAPTAFDLDSSGGAAGDDTGVSSADNITNKTTGLTITGTSENLATIQLWEGAMQLATTPATITANGSGVWTADISLSAGSTHLITALQTDVAGNVSPVNSTTLSITVDTSAPSASNKPELNSGDDSGISNSDYLTKTTSGLTFTTAATIESNAYVQLFVDGVGQGTVYANQATAGIWSGDISLTAGTHSITTVVTDVAGNSSGASAARSVRVDTSSPTLNPRTIYSTNANPLYAKSGDKIIVKFTSNETLVNNTGFFPSGNIDGKTLIFPTPAGATVDSAYVTANNTFSEAALTFSYTVYDSAGNSTTHSTATGSVTYDNTPPVVSTIVVTTPPIPNAWSTSNGTSANTVTFTVTFAEPVIGSSVNPNDFIATGLDYGGNVSYPLVTGTVSNVSPVSGTAYTVTVNTISNTGRLRLDLKGTATIQDNAGITSNAAFTTGQTFSLVLPVPTNIQGTPTATSNGTQSITVNWTNSITAQTPTHLLITATGPDNQDPAVTPAEFVPTNGNTTIALRALPPEDSDFSDGKGLHIVTLTGALSTSYQFTTLLSGKAYTFKFYPFTLSPNNSAFPDNTNYLLTGIKSASASTQTASEGSIAAGSTAPPATIGSLTTSFGSKNFTFKLDDDGLNSGADVSKTVFNTITIRAGLSNTVTNWQNVIAEAELKTITEAQTVLSTNIVGNTIIFTTAFTNDKEGELDDNEEKEYELRIRLKSSMLNGADTTIDNQVFDFFVDNSSFAFETGSSQFNGSESETSGASVNKVTVLADRLVAIAQPPSTALVFVNVSPQALLRTRDANGNTDLDYGSKVKITNTQSLPMSGLLTSDSLKAVSGVIKFPANFQYTDDGTGAANNGTLTVTGKASTLTNTNVVALNNTTVSYSATTTITAGALAEPSQIPSTTTNFATPLAVFDFKINDDNNSGGDGSPTRITEIKITQGPSNGILNWTDVIQDAELVYTSASSGNGTILFSVGVVNSTDITFTGLSTAVGAAGYIADNDSKTYTLRIYLKTSTVSPALIDNVNLVFRITNVIPTNLTLGSQSSNLAASDINSGTTNNAIDVDATEIRIVTQPVADILVNKDINLQPGQSPNPAVQITDINGNRDLDFGDVGTQTITVTNAQSLPMSNVPSLPVDGLLTFANGFQYDGIGTGASGNGTLTFARTGLTGVSSQAVTVRVATSGTITAGATTEAATISSLVDTNGEKVEMFDFTINDDPSLAETNSQSDGNPIQISQIRITKNAAVGANTISVWSDAIAVAILSDGNPSNDLIGTVSANDITFGTVATPILNGAGQLGYIADGTFSVASNKTYNLIIYLRSSLLGGTLPETIDGLRFGFEVTSANITTLSTGTRIIGSENENSDPASAGKGVVDVAASVIHFTSVPASASVSVNLTPTVVVKARDVNGNRDLDFDNQVITAFGNTPEGGEGAYGTVNGPVTNSTDEFDDGIFTFNPNFQFTTGSDTTQLTMQAGGLFGTSPYISVISSFESVLRSGNTGSSLNHNIDYALYQASNISVPDTLSSNADAIEYLLLEDGGIDRTDLDGAATVLDDLELGISNPQSIRNLAIYTLHPVTKVVKEIQEYPGPGASRTLLGDYAKYSFTNLNIRAGDKNNPDSAGYMRIYVLATFEDDSINIQDRDTIQVTVLTASTSIGSGFAPDPGQTNSIGGVVKTALSFPPSQTATLVGSKGRYNKIQATATSLDFITPASPYAGMNEPIGPSYTSPPQPSTSAAVVYARDKFGVLDVDFHNVPVDDIYGGTSTGVSDTSVFNHGILDLDGMQYTSAGDGTLTVEAGGINSSTPVCLTCHSVPGQPVDVINVTASLAPGALAPSNIKGGTTGAIIFGVTFTPEHSTTTEPSLSGFTFSFDHPYKTATTTTLKGFEVREESTDVTTLYSGATVTEVSSTNDQNFDLIVVDFPGIKPELSNPNDGSATPKSYYLVVDVDLSANISTQNLRPQLIDKGYDPSPDTVTDNNILLTKGTATANLIGQTYQFASTKPPVLQTASTSKTMPYRGQLNVDANLNTITLEFDVQVWSLDGKAELFDSETNTKVADLSATNGVFTSTLTPPQDSIVFDINFLAGKSFKADSVYYIKVAKGSFNNVTNTGEGISDNGFNFYGGTSFNGTLYFKVSSVNPPYLASAKPYFSNLTAGVFSTTFDKTGTAYYMVIDHSTYVAQGNGVGNKPTISDIEDPASYITGHAGAVILTDSFEITQISSAQYVSFNANLLAGKTYDVWVFAKSDANPTPIVAPQPYGQATTHVIGGTGPTTQLIMPLVANIKYTKIPDYLLCPESYVLLTEPVVLSEKNPGDFTQVGTQDFYLLLPAGFQFNGVDKPTVQLNGGDFDQSSLQVDFVNNTIIHIEYKNELSGSIDNIIITDLYLIGETGKAGNILRFGGDAVLPVLTANKLASLTVFTNAPLKFTNSYSLDNDFTPFGFPTVSGVKAIIKAIPDNYIDPDLGGNIQLMAINLPANDYAPSIFGGNGVTNDLLNLGAVALDAAFDITITHESVNGCLVESSEQYVVYDHTTPISLDLGVTQDGVHIGTTQALSNPNFLTGGYAPSPAPSTDQINSGDIAGYRLIDLFAAIPTNLTGSQIISGTAWASQVAKIPVVAATIVEGTSPTGYKRDYKWDYSHIINAVNEEPAITVQPYDNFRDTTLNGNIFWNGGSLGKIEFIGRYQSTADLTLSVPFRQQVELFVPPIPIIEVSGESDFLGDTAIYCQSQSIATLNGWPDANAGSSTGYFELYDAKTNAPIHTLSIHHAGFTDNENGVAALQPGLLYNNYQTIRVEYTFQQNGSPSYGKGVYYIKITPNPIPDFTASSVLPEDGVITHNTVNYVANKLSDGRPDLVNSFCEDSWIYFENKTRWPAGVDPTLYTAQTNPKWNMGDPSSSTNTPANEPDIVFQMYDDFGKYDITFSVESQFGCPSGDTTKSVYVGVIPTPDFSMTGISTATPIVVKTSTSISSGSSYPKSDTLASSWNFNSPINADEGALTYSASSFDTTYTTPGHYTITMRAVTQITDVPSGTIRPGCEISYQRPVIIVPAVASIVSTYDNLFESNNASDQWQTSGTYLRNGTRVPGSSWVRAVSIKDSIASSTKITSPTNVWVTNAHAQYDTAEVSYLYSAALDISALARPMVSFSNWVHMDDTTSVNDGVALDFSTDMLNITDPNKKWYRFGKSGEGINWYDRQGLASKPGSQLASGQTIPSGDFGWGSEGSGWVKSMHAMSPDIAIPRDRVILRFSLASVGNGGQGIAIDSFRIGERTRVILVENFSNLGSPATSNEKAESDFLQGNFNNGAIVGTDFVKLVYHVGFPEQDPFNLDNPADPGARALYYNVASTPQVRLDGFTRGTFQASGNNEFSKWGKKGFDDRTIELAKAKLEFIPAGTGTTIEGAFKAQVRVTAIDTLPTSTILHIVLAERRIEFSPTVGQGMVHTGEESDSSGFPHSFEYVVKKMLPSALGTRFTKVLNPNVPADITMDFPSLEWRPDGAALYDDADDMVIIAFLQDEVTKEIHQAIMYDVIVPDPASITGVEDPDYAKKINLYPNPANNVLNILLPTQVNKTTPISVVDTYGRTVYEKAFKVGEQEKEISTTDLASGVYVIQIITPDGNIARRKIMVVHH